MAYFPPMTEREPIVDAVFKVAGNASVLARHLKITPQSVHQWKQIPLERVRAVEKITGISRHRLRPDFFDPPESSAA
jgi:DNA-binding transcriptional regulator YdaS (Cro superfamily)